MITKNNLSAEEVRQMAGNPETTPEKGAIGKSGCPSYPPDHTSRFLRKTMIC
jgi:hypothetical protein